jgi:hypothetical protein
LRVVLEVFEGDLGKGAVAEDDKLLGLIPGN